MWEIEWLPYQHRGRTPHLLDGLGLANELQAAGIPTKAEVTGRAGNPGQQTLSGAPILNGMLCFLVNMGTWASKRWSGAGLLRRTNPHGKDKQQDLFPGHCYRAKPHACSHPWRQTWCHSRWTEGHMEAPREVTGPRSQAARVQY